MSDNEKTCLTCGNCCMDMDMDPYCAAVNQPYGRPLYRGRPSECGPESKLWIPDARRIPDLEAATREARQEVNAIRQALGTPEATIPEMCARIRELREREQQP